MSSHPFYPGEFTPADEFTSPLPTVSPYPLYPPVSSHQPVSSHPSNPPASSHQPMSSRQHVSSHPFYPGEFTPAGEFRTTGHFTPLSPTDELMSRGCEFALRCEFARRACRSHPRHELHTRDMLVTTMGRQGVNSQKISHIRTCDHLAPFYLVPPSPEWYFSQNIWPRLDDNTPSSPSSSTRPDYHPAPDHPSSHPEVWPISTAGHRSPRLPGWHRTPRKVQKD
jgi:hypothetical protein